MKKYFPQLFYLISFALIYPLVISFGNFIRLLTGHGARTYLVFYLILPLIIIAAIIGLIYLAREIKHYNDIDG